MLEFDVHMSDGMEGKTDIKCGGELTKQTEKNVSPGPYPELGEYADSENVNSEKSCF